MENNTELRPAKCAICNARINDSEYDTAIRSTSRGDCPDEVEVVYHHKTCIAEVTRMMKAVN